MKKAVAYYRVSTEKQHKSTLGLEAQKEAVMGYLEVNGLQLHESYTEIESGAKRKRPELLRALEECNRAGAKLVIAKLDRLSRNMAFIANLMESRVDFVAVDNPHASKLMIHIISAFAEHERDMISQRTKEALKVAKAKGKELGKNGKYVLAPKNKAEAQRFAESMKSTILQLEAKGYNTLEKQVKALNDMNVPTFTNKGHWHLSTLWTVRKRIGL